MAKHHTEYPDGEPHSTDPSTIPTRDGDRVSDDLLANAGSGRSGPDDVGTQVHDAQRLMLGGPTDPASPTARLWRAEDEDKHKDEARHSRADRRSAG